MEYLHTHSHRSSSIQDPESSLYRAHEEIDILHQKVLTLESQLETTHSNMGLLQGLLQESCKREWEHLDVRKRTAEDQMTKAQRVVSEREGGRREKGEKVIALFSSDSVTRSRSVVLPSLVPYIWLTLQH